MASVREGAGNGRCRIEPLAGAGNRTGLAGNLTVAGQCRTRTGFPLYALDVRAAAHPRRRLSECNGFPL